MLSKEQAIYDILRAELPMSVDNEIIGPLARDLAAAFERWHENALVIDGQDSAPKP